MFDVIKLVILCKRVVLTTALLVVGLGVQAQVGTLDSKKILASQPIFAKIDTMVMGEQEKYIRDYRDLVATAQRSAHVADSLSALPALRGSSALSTAVQSAQAAQKAIKDYEAMVDRKLGEYKSVLVTPYIEKVNAAIKAVALRLKLKQVIDLQQVPLVYAAPESDITQDVINELRKN